MKTLKNLAPTLLLALAIGLPVLPPTAIHAAQTVLPGQIKLCSGDQEFIRQKYNELEAQGQNPTYTTEIGSDGDWVYCVTW